MALSDAIAAIQTAVAALPGIKAAPASPPESVDVFPFSVCYARSGECLFASANFANYLHTLVVEIHTSREILQYAIDAMLPYIESFPQLVLADPTLSGTVSECNAVRYEFGGMKYGSVDTIGVRFQVDVKLHLEAS